MARELRSQRLALTEELDESSRPSTPLPPTGKQGRGKKRRQIDQEQSQKRIRARESPPTPPSHQPELSQVSIELELLEDTSEITTLDSEQAPAPTDLQHTNQDSQIVISRPAS